MWESRRRKRTKNACAVVKNTCPPRTAAILVPEPDSHAARVPLIFMVNVGRFIILLRYKCTVYVYEDNILRVFLLYTRIHQGLLILSRTIIIYNTIQSRGLWWVESTVVDAFKQVANKKRVVYRVYVDF